MENAGQIRTMFNDQFRSDTKQIFKLCLPYIFSYILELLLIPTVSIIFMGWIGQLEFNACVLARSLYLILVHSGNFGLTYACDTLLSQAYGGNKRRMGIIIQQAFVIGLNVVVLTWILLVNVQYLTHFLGKNEEMTGLINRYLSFSMITAPLEGFSIIMQKFVINHGVTSPLIVINAIGNIVNILVHYVLLYIFSLGVGAPPIALGCAYLSMGLSCIIYLYLSRTAENTWHPWTRDCLKQWSLYLKLGIPGIIITFFQTTVYAGATLLATLFGDDAITAQGVVFYVDYFIFLITLAFAVSSTIIIGRYLGAGLYERAQQTKNTVYIIALILIVLTIICGLSVVYWIPYLFHTPESARSQTRYLSAIVIICCAFDFYHLSQASILRACGRQYFDAVVSFSAYFFVGIPTGILFIYVLHLNMAGYWFALMSSLVVTNIIFFVYLRQINWQEQAERAQMNICTKEEINERTLVLPADEQTQDASMFNFIKIKLICFILFVVVLLFSLFLSFTLRK